MTHELYKKYRPKKFSQLRGQDKAVDMLAALLKKGLPHALLLIGPSGCGKTTVARILRRKLNCSPKDFNEIDSADFRGVDTIRDIRHKMRLHPLGGKTKIYLLDECHKLTNDAQTALLKMLEDTPRHVYFVLATTDPQKLIKTIKTRCTKVKMDSLDSDTMRAFLKEICEKEGAKISTQVFNRIIDVADGSPRLALVTLGQVIGIDSEKKQLEIIQSTVYEKDAILICRALLNAKKWDQVVEVLKDLNIADSENAESMRRMVLGYATTCLLSSNKRIQGRAYVIISAFREDLFHSGKAGFVANCYEVFTSK